MKQGAFKFMTNLQYLAFCVCFCLASLSIIEIAIAQSEQAAESTQQTAIKNLQVPFEVPHVNILSKMIQSHMAALSNAIVTNNFSVLRNLGTSKFQNTNSADALSKTFHPFRQNRLDVTRVVIYTPILKNAPRVDETGKLRLKGYYNTAPSRILFDFSFFPSFGKWKMDAISVHVEPPQQQPSGNQSKVIERTIVSGTNMRTSPSIQGELLATLQPGQKIHVLGQVPNGEWHRVLVAPNTQGFIKTSVLQKNSK